MSKNGFNPNEKIVSGKVIATVNVGVSPAAMAITSDSAFLYVANSNNYSIAGSDTVTLIDLKNCMPLKTITHESFNQPYTITLSKDGKKAYVTNSNSTTISIIETKSNKVVGVIDGFNGPSGMVITHDGKKAYVNNYGAIDTMPSGQGNTVTVVDLESEKIIERIRLNEYGEVPAAPSAIAITPIGDFIYTANYVTGNANTSTVTKISTKTNTVVDRISGFFGPFSIAIDAEGKNAYLTNFGSNNYAPYGITVSILNLDNHKVTDINTGGIQPAGFAITPDRKYGFVSNYNTLYSTGAPQFTGLTAGQGTVNIIDLSTNLLVPMTINVGQSPGSIVMSPDTKYAIVSNYVSNTVSIISVYDME
jgi:YVTN family beta-propeller protein